MAVEATNSRRDRLSIFPSGFGLDRVVAARATTVQGQDSVCSRFIPASLGQEYKGERSAESPGAITHYPGAVAGRVARIAQRKPLRLQITSRGLAQETGDGQVPACILRPELRPFRLLDCRCRCRVETLGGGIGMVVREIGADHDQSFVVSPKPRQHLAHFLRLGIADAA